MATLGLCAWKSSIASRRPPPEVNVPAAGHLGALVAQVPPSSAGTTRTKDLPHLPTIR